MRRSDKAHEIAREIDQFAADEVEQVLTLLDGFAAPSPPTSAAALIERLRPLMPAPAPARRRFRQYGLTESPLLTTAGYLLAQVRLYRPVWWLGTAAAAALGLLGSKAIQVTPTLMAPILVAAGLAYSFREVDTPTMEMELSCPVSPVQVLLARTLVVTGWVTVLGLALGGASALLGVSYALGDWLAGMLFCCGVTLVAILGAGPRLGPSLAVAGWLGLMLLRMGHAWWYPRNGVIAALGVGLMALACLWSGRLRRVPRREE